MCGIAGIIAPESERVDQAVRVMNLAQRHRGPDDEGIEVLATPAGFLGLGHRRLSILDLTRAGHQPMVSPLTGDWLVFNGEIYNYIELRQELRARGYQFASQTDTEVILHAFAEWGTDCLERLRGMYALAVYLASRRQLILARDPLGIKPLYWCVFDRGLGFASEIRALDAAGLTSMEVDRPALAGLLAYGAVQGPLTIRKGVRLLEPGSMLTLPLEGEVTSGDRICEQPFWQFPEPLQSPSRESAVPEIRRLLNDAADSHQLSDVPVGVFLSGGLDSTALAILCAKRNSASINTFTIGVEDRAETDERQQAAATAERLGTRHTTIVLSRSSFRKSVEDWLSCLDQPSVDGLNTYVISEAVRKHGIKVALSGLGSDEIFGGYSTFRDVPCASRVLSAVQWLPTALRKGVTRVLCARCDATQRQKAVETAVSSPNVRSQYHRRRRLFSDCELERFGLDVEELGLDESYLVYQQGVVDDPLPSDRAGAVSRLECRHYMGNMLLRDSDICGMAHGVEIRVPFLHQPLLEYVMSLPGAWRVSKPGLSKPLLVDALDSDLVYALATQEKRGFTIINAEWLTSVAREPLEDFLETLRHSGHVEPGAISEVWRTFLKDPRGPIWSRIWMLGVLGAWIADRRAQ